MGCIRTIIGFFLLAVGLYITIGTYTQASIEGGTYLICYGAIIVGVIMFIPGLIKYFPIAISMLFGLLNTKSETIKFKGGPLIDLIGEYEHNKIKITLRSTQNTSANNVDINDWIYSSIPLLFADQLVNEMHWSGELFTDNTFLKGFITGQPYKVRVLDKDKGTANIIIRGKYVDNSIVVVPTMSQKIEAYEEFDKVLHWRSDFICLYIDHFFKNSPPERKMKLFYWILYIYKLIHVTITSEYEKISNKPIATFFL